MDLIPAERPCFLKLLIQCQVIRRKEFFIFGSQKIGDTHLRRMLARHERYPRRRAHWRGCVRLCETDTIARQTIQHRCLVKTVSITTQLTPTQVVGHDIDDIGFLSVCFFREKQPKTSQHESQIFLFQTHTLCK
jgi:hypothetical protein